MYSLSGMMATISVGVSFLLALYSSPCSSAPIGTLSASRAPIVLNLKRVATNDTGIAKLLKSGVRTQSRFFEDTLRIMSGKPFNLDLDRWNAIQRSGLFKNLTAEAIPIGRNEVALRISGVELPSIRFSPEISVAASIDRPEVSGGVAFSDRNFRGLGQRLDVQISKKEGREFGTDELSPTVVVKWTDNNIGKSSSVSVGYERESRFEDGADIIPNMRLAPFMDLGISQGQRFETTMQRAYVRFKESDVLRIARKFLVNEQLSRSSPSGSRNRNRADCLMEVEVEPYRAVLDNAMSVVELQGAKLSTNWLWKDGLSVGLSHDGGVGMFQSGSAPYRQIKGEAASPIFPIMKSFTRKLKIPDGSKVAVKGEELSQKNGLLQFVGRLRASTMKSWGGACLPLHHQIPLGTSLTVRSYADRPDPAFLDLFGSHKKRTSAYLAFKADMYLDGLRTFIPGFFLDCAVFNDLAVSEENCPILELEKALGIGLSLSIMKSRKSTFADIAEEMFHTPYFHSTKKLGSKDEVIVGMLESCQEKGPCYVITDPELADNPIIYASEGFCRFTGYTKHEIEGRNCRFLQGKDSSPADVAKIREAITKKEATSLCLLNYKKDGSTFLNQFFLTPLFGEDGNLAYYLGVQAEVKARCHYPGKESVNPGWKMFKYFDSNITDEVSASHNEAPYVNYSNRQPAATFAI